MNPIFATTERLILRDYLPADLPLYIELSADPEVMRYLGDATALYTRIWDEIKAHE